jgi:hypothetical protein
MKTPKNSSERLPSFQFYPGDWLTDTSLRMCSPETRGVWIDLLCHMHMANERGFLMVSDVFLDAKGIQKLSNLNPKKFQKVFHELKHFGIIKENESGQFYSKRMVGDERLRKVRRESGKLGGNPKLVKKGSKKVEHLVNQNSNQNPTPSFSFSFSNSNNNNKDVIIDENVFHPIIDHITKNCPNIKKLKTQLKISDAEKLDETFGFKNVIETLDSMENYKPLISKYSSVFLTCKKWLSNKNAKPNGNNINNPKSKPNFDDAVRNF